MRGIRPYVTGTEVELQDIAFSYGGGFSIARLGQANLGHSAFQQGVVIQGDNYSLFVVQPVGKLDQPFWALRVGSEHEAGLAL